MGTFEPSDSRDEANRPQKYPPVMDPIEDAIRQIRASMTEFPRPTNKTPKPPRYETLPLSVRAEMRRQERAIVNAHVAARKKVKNALRAAKLVKPNVCEDCGSTEPLDAHHDDYAKPLEVRFLCLDCHRSHHPELSEALFRHRC